MTEPANTQRRGRRTLLLIALVSIAPVVASYSVYYWFPREKFANYGELLQTREAPQVTGSTLAGQPFRISDLRGRWVLAVAAPAPCDAACAQALYATRQARTIQNKEMERVARVWLVTGDGAPDPAMLAADPDLVVARVASTGLSAWGAADRLYLVDPLGNLVLAYPRNPDIKAMASDLTRLLKASRIG